MDKMWSSVCGFFKRRSTGDDCVVNDLQMDSRSVQKGDVFIAIQGVDLHGLSFLSQAIERGAVAVLSDRSIPACPVPCMVINDLKAQLGQLADAFYGQPSRKLAVLAVTGTNGKTSVAWFLAHALNAMGQKAAYVGTLGTGLVNDLNSSINTTPSVLKIHQSLAAYVEQGVTHVAIEVSSHALDQGRLDGVRIKQSLFTNLSRDHLDYHKDMNGYAEAKKRLFTEFHSQIAVINADDAIGASWLSQALNCDMKHSVAIKAKADWRVSDILANETGLTFDVVTQGEQLTIETPLMGRFNVENLLLVMAAVQAEGCALHQMPQVIKSLVAVPGRMQVVHDVNNNKTWVVDYAHTPDALQSVLTAMRDHVKGRLWCVFGCGGDRDAGKRSLMGQAAEQGADVVVVTSDNPRTESPEAIIDDVLQGMERVPHVVVDRKAAIEHAHQKSQNGDVIVLAGKGHEDYQEVLGVKHPFSDVAVIEAVMQEAA